MPLPSVGEVGEGNLQDPVFGAPLAPSQGRRLRLGPGEEG